MISSLHKKELKKELILLIFWSLSDFIYRTTFSVQDGQYADLITSSSASGFHYFLTFPRMAGFLLFPLSRRIFHSEKSRKALLMGINLLYLFSIPATFFVKAPGLILLFLTLSSISLGYVTGGIYYDMAMGLSTSKNRGKIIAIGSSAALLLQFLFQKILNNFYFLTAATVITFTIIVYLIIHPPADWSFDNPLAFARETPSWHRSIIQHLVLAVLIILIMQPLCIGNDTYFINANFSSTVDIYGLSRFCMIPGYLIAGFFADRRQGRYYPGLLFIAFLLSIPTVMLPVYPESGAYFLPLYYFYVSFYLYFLCYTFWTLAPKTRHPDFWASHGRVFSDLLEGVSFLILPLIPMQDPLIRVIIYTASLIILFLLLIESGFYPNLLPNSMGRIPVSEAPAPAKNTKNYMPAADYPASRVGSQDNKNRRSLEDNGSSQQSYQADQPSQGSELCQPQNNPSHQGDQDYQAASNIELCQPQDDHSLSSFTEILPNEQEGPESNMKEFLSQFPFTPRESEIASVLLSTEDPMKALAIRFEISERSIYRYSRSIYSKTGTETRAGLIKLYYEWLNT